MDSCRYDRIIARASSIHGNKPSLRQTGAVYHVNQVDRPVTMVG